MLRDFLKNLNLRQIDYVCSLRMKTFFLSFWRPFFQTSLHVQFMPKHNFLVFSRF